MTSAAARTSSSSMMLPSSSLCHTGQIRSICPNCHTASPAPTSVKQNEPCWTVMWVQEPLVGNTFLQPPLLVYRLTRVLGVHGTVQR